LTLSVGLVSWAVLRGHQGGRFALAGLAVCLLLLTLAPEELVEMWFALGFAALALGLLVTMGIRMQEHRRQATDALLTSKQLEVQLLKRSIQPHFLMNTLTSLQEWVEVAPAQASSFIDALAAEFRLLSQIASEPLIPIETEIELCRSHLAVMSLSRDVPFSLRAAGPLAGDRVPPAIFHTLVENGISHGRFAPTHAEFLLESRRSAGRRTYRFLSPELPGAPSSRSPDGTGLRYIRARLTESFQDRWRLTSAATDDGWETIIELDDAF
jgi:LytS/YehU family sensor histidine kinase